LSVDGPHDSAAELAPETVATTPSGADGGTVSEHAAVVVEVAAAAETLPDAS
jgi:hypothetical protein